MGALELVDNLRLEVKDMHLMDDFPAWYDLGIKKTTLQILVRNDAFEFFVSNCTKYRLIPKMVELSDAELIAPTNSAKGVFGFGPICDYRPSKRANWVLCEIALPNYDQLARPHACTIALLLTMLEFWGINQEKINPEDPVQNPQLMLANIEWSGTGMNNHGLWVGVSPALARWIAKQPFGESAEINKAMTTVALHMSSLRGGEFIRKYRECRAEYDAYNGIYFRCNGDACELGHGGAQNSNPNPRPYSMGPHNVDYFQQQFTLLAGAAKLCQIARQEIG